MRFSIAVLIAFPTTSLGFAPVTKPAFSACTQLAYSSVVTGPEGKPASSSEEDLELTYQIIMGFIKDDDTTDEAPSGNIMISGKETTAQDRLETSTEVSNIKEKVAEEAFMASRSQATPKVIKRSGYGGYTKSAPHINAHLLSLGGDDQDAITDIASKDGSVPGKIASVALKEKEDVSEKDVMEAASEFFSGDMIGSEDYVPNLGIDGISEEKKDITEEDVLKAASEFFSGASNVLDEAVLSSKNDNIVEDPMAKFEKENVLDEHTEAEAILSSENDNIVGMEQDVLEKDASNDALDIPSNDPNSLDEASMVLENDTVLENNYVIMEDDTLSAAPEISPDDLNPLEEELLAPENDVIVDEPTSVLKDDNIPDESVQSVENYEIPEEPEPELQKNTPPERTKPKPFTAFEDFDSPHKDSRGFTWY